MLPLHKSDTTNRDKDNRTNRGPVFLKRHSKPRRVANNDTTRNQMRIKLPTVLKGIIAISLSIMVLSITSCARNPNRVQKFGSVVVLGGDITVLADKTLGITNKYLILSETNVFAPKDVNHHDALPAEVRLSASEYRILDTDMKNSEFVANSRHGKVLKRYQIREGVALILESNSYGSTSVRIQVSGKDGLSIYEKNDISELSKDISEAVAWLDK